MRLLLAILLLLTFTASAQSGPDASVFEKPLNLKQPSSDFLKVKSALAGATVIRSDFKQKKSIAVLKKPIVSAGRYIYSRKLGLYWHIGPPVNTSYVLTPDYMVEKQKGFKDKVVTPKEQPSLFALTEVFEAIFIGDLERLSQDFKIHFVGDSKRWTIGLIPQRGLLKKMFRRVLLTGGQTVSEVKLMEANGDSTHLKFQGVTRKPDTLSSPEKALFEK